MVALNQGYVFYVLRRATIVEREHREDGDLVHMHLESFNLPIDIPLQCTSFPSPSFLLSRSFKSVAEYSLYLLPPVLSVCLSYR